MTKFSMLLLAIITVAGCSSSNNDETFDSGADNNGMGNNQTGIDASLESIVSATASSQAVVLELQTLQNSLDALQGTEPVPVVTGDTVQSLLSKAQAQ